MALSILFERENPGQIHELLLDATIRDVHDYTNQVTQYPVEDGSVITDHIRLNSDKVTIEGFVTNSPVAFLNAFGFGIVRRDPDGKLQAKNLRSGDVKNRVETSLEALLEISGRKIGAPNREPLVVSLVTGLRVYNDMAIENLNIPRDVNNSKDHMRFTASFINIRTARTETVALPNVQEDIRDEADSTVNRGKTSAAEATVEETEAAEEAVRDSFLFGALIGG